MIKKLFSILLLSILAINIFYPKYEAKSDNRLYQTPVTTPSEPRICPTIKAGDKFRQEDSPYILTINTSTTKVEFDSVDPYWPKYVPIPGVHILTEPCFRHYYPKQDTNFWVSTYNGYSGQMFVYGTYVVMVRYELVYNRITDTKAYKIIGYEIKKVGDAPLIETWPAVTNAANFNIKSDEIVDFFGFKTFKDAQAYGNSQVGKLSKITHPLKNFSSTPNTLCRTADLNPDKWFFYVGWPNCAFALAVPIK